MSFRIERQGALPIAPSPTPLANEVLASIRVETNSPQILEGGEAALYLLSGFYIFDHLIPIIPGTDTLTAPTTDADTLTPSQVAITPNQFKSGLI